MQYCTKKELPVISMFHGLLLSINNLDYKQLHLPHSYVIYNEFEAIFSIPQMDKFKKQNLTS